MSRTEENHKELYRALSWKSGKVTTPEPEGVRGDGVREQTWRWSNCHTSYGGGTWTARNIFILTELGK